MVHLGCFLSLVQVCYLISGPKHSKTPFFDPKHHFLTHKGKEKFIFFKSLQFLSHDAGIAKWHVFILNEAFLVAKSALGTHGANGGCASPGIMPGSGSDPRMILRLGSCVPAVFGLVGIQLVVSQRIPAEMCNAGLKCWVDAPLITTNLTTS